MSWSKFPTEIQLQIITFLDRDDCKNFRLTSKSNASLIEQKLFYTVHLTPNMRSFDRAHSIATSRLSRHVHAIVFHVGVLEDIHNGFSSFRDDVMRLHHPSGSIDDITKDILWKYNCFHEEMEGQQDFSSRIEIDELNQLCQHFGSVESITTILDEEDPFTPPQDFIGRRTGVHSACAADGSHFSSLFNAMAGKQLTKIHAWSTSWFCLIKIVTEDFVRKVNMSGMRELALGLFNSEFLESEPKDKESSLEALDTFLRTSLTSEPYVLLIDFDEIPFESESGELLQISRILFKHHWPSLRRLALQGIVTTETEIIDFLENHSASLRHLHLDDIELEDEVTKSPDDNTATLPGSIIVLFRRITEILRLDSASISGCFTNRYNESWYVDVEYEDDECLRHGIEMWLSHKAPAPFSTDLLHADRKTKEEILKDIYAQDGPINCGIDTMIPRPGADWTDESWVWDMDYEWYPRGESEVDVE